MSTTLTNGLRDAHTRREAACRAVSVIARCGNARGKRVLIWLRLPRADEAAGDDVRVDNAAQPPRPFTAADLTALPGLAAIRRRPRMYFGVDQRDPTLPGQVMRYAVHGLLDEASPGTLSRIEVVIESNLVFSITDDGLGLPVDPDRPGLPSRLAQLLTMLMAGGGPGLAPVTAMCSALVADVWHDGFHYRQWADWEHPAPPMQARGRTDRHGTRLLAHLDSSYLGPAAALPFDSAWLSGRAGLAIPATVHIGITDKRHGQPTATAG